MKILNIIAKLLGIHNQRDYTLENRTLEYVKKFKRFKDNVLFTEAYNIKGKSLIRLYLKHNQNLRYKAIASMGHFFKASVEVYVKIQNEHRYELLIDIEYHHLN